MLDSKMRYYEAVRDYIVEMGARREALVTDMRDFDRSEIESLFRPMREAQDQLLTQVESQIARLRSA